MVVLHNLLLLLSGYFGYLDGINVSNCEKLINNFVCETNYSIEAWYT